MDDTPAHKELEINAGADADESGSRELLVLSKAEQTEILRPRAYHCEDNCPCIIRCPYRCVTGVCGPALFFLLFLPLFLLFQLCGLLYTVLCCCGGRGFTDKSRLVRDREYGPTVSGCKCGCCGPLRVFNAQCRLCLIVNHCGGDRNLVSICVGFYQLLEHIANGTDPAPALDNTLANEFGDYFPFLSGIGVAQRRAMLQLMHDPRILKKRGVFVFHTCNALAQYSEYTPPCLSSTDPRCAFARHIVHAWMTGFNLDLLLGDEEDNHNHNRNVSSHTSLFTKACPPLPLAGKGKAGLETLFSNADNVKRDRTYVNKCFSSIFFYLATETAMTAAQLKALDSLVSPMGFLPNWVHFFLCGFYFERKVAADYDVFLRAFVTNWRSAAFQSVLSFYRKRKTKTDVDVDMDLREAARLLAAAFNIAGMVAPCRLCREIVERIYSDKALHVPQWRQAPQRFIRECARLSKGVPVVTVLTPREAVYNIGGKNVTLPRNTEMLCSVQLANRDPAVFVNPDVFDPQRDNLGEIASWNGLEKAIIGGGGGGGGSRGGAAQSQSQSQSQSQPRPPRACPGHDLSFVIIEYLTNFLLDRDDQRAAAAVAAMSSDDERSDDALLSANKRSGHGHGRGLGRGAGAGHWHRIGDDDEEVDVERMDVHELYERQATHRSFEAVANHAIFEGLDTYTKMTLTFMKFAVAKHNANPPMCKHIPLPSITNAKCKLFAIGAGIRFAEADEDVKENLIKTLARKVLNSKLVGGFVDSNEAWPSISSALDFKEKYFAQLPPPNQRYDELTSNDAISRLAFASMCCHYTKRVTKKQKRADNHNNNNNNNAEDADADMKEQPQSGSENGAVPVPPPPPENAAFASDFSALYGFPVKSGYERYGAIAYFDAKCRVIGIYWCHASRFVAAVDDSDSESGASAEDVRAWKHAKWVWKCTFFAHVTVVDHLFETHFLKSNLLLRATVDHLPLTHPLRIFLKPFVYRAVTVNQQAQKSLSPPRGLVHRLWAFEHETVLKIFAFAHENYRFRLLPDFVDESMRDVDDNVFGFNADCNAFWIVMRNYVDSFLSIYYPPREDEDAGGSGGGGVGERDADLLVKDHSVRLFSEALSAALKIAPIASYERFVDVLTQLIVSCNAIHEHVGQVSDFVMSPDWMGARLRPNEEICSVQEYAQLLALTVMTGLAAPKLMGDWSHLIHIGLKRQDDDNDANYKQVLRVYQQWHQDLNALCHQIDNQNKARVYPTMSMNPRVMECSVSV